MLPFACSGRRKEGAPARSDEGGDVLVDSFSEWNPVLQAFLAAFFTFLMTGVGAAFVFGMRSINRRMVNLMLGFAAGVMIAASVWSLLIPAMDLAEADGLPRWMPALVGFALGGLFLFAVDRVLPHLHPGPSSDYREGIKTSWSRSTLLVGALTLHNIPEGLAVGVAFGAAAQEGGTTLAAAAALALGIGIQNVPEGTAVSVPLRGAGMSRLKSFVYGVLSGAVEPVAAVVGAAAVALSRPILPYVLAFAAGAMIYVVVEEVIPESQRGEHADLATGGAMGGFALMMLLDVALG
ncbi:MAG: ZIP family metal transporter [Thermoleophilia bacterium]|nr:ZIP family metal transporter [Thermoleophilia bacterium]